MVAKPKQTPAASYVRMSTDKQETSPEQQREAIAKLAIEHGYEIVATYEDLGVSGNNTEKRAGFRRMIADGSTRKFEAILCWDQDRFGRFDLIEAGKWIEPLRSAGVSLVTTTGGAIDWTTLTGQLGYMASQMGKAQYLRDLSANVRRGQDRVEKLGRWTRGFAPFGYEVDSETGKLIPAKPSEVRILKAIFEQYAAGKSYREIAAWLTSQGVKTRRGNNWQQQSIRHTVNNVVYRGHLAYGKSTASKYLPYGSPSGDRINRPESEWSVITNCHEPLVSQELFDRCHQRKAKNKNMTGPKSKNRYALTGLLFCKNCGSRLCGTSAKGENVKRYICIDYQNSRGTCERRTVKEDLVLGEILKAIRTEFIDKFFGSAEREAIKDQMREILLEGSGDIERNRAADRQRLAETEGELEQAVNAMLSTSEDLRPLVEKRVRTIQDERDTLTDRLAKTTAPASEQIARAEERIDSAIRWLDRLEAIVGTEYDPPVLAEMLGQFIERVDVDIERVPCGKRSSHKLRGGVIYFRAESFPAWAVPVSQELASPLGTSCFEALD